MTPDFINVYTSGTYKTMFPAEDVFNFDKWHQFETYIQIVQEEEDPTTFTMKPNFNLCILQQYKSDQECNDLLANIPHSETMV